MISVLARACVTLARIGAVALSLVVGGFLIWRAQDGESGVSARTAAAAPVPVAEHAGAASPDSLPEVPPAFPPAEFAAPAMWLSSSKSLDLAEYPTGVFRPPLVLAEPVAPVDGEPQAVQQPLPIPRARVYLHSSKSSTTFVPPSTPASGWEIVW
jgi:hypothetical protein